MKEVLFFWQFQNEFRSFSFILYVSKMHQLLLVILFKMNVNFLCHNFLAMLGSKLFYVSGSFHHFIGFLTVLFIESLSWFQMSFDMLFPFVRGSVKNQALRAIGEKLASLCIIRRTLIRQKLEVLYILCYFNNNNMTNQFNFKNFV